MCFLLIHEQDFQCNSLFIAGQWIATICKEQWTVKLMDLNRKVPFSLSKMEVKSKSVAQKGQDQLKLAAPKGNRQLSHRTELIHLQNHGTVKFERVVLWSSSPACLLKQGELEQVTQNYIKLSLGYLHRWRLHNCSGYPMTVFDHLLSKEKFFMTLDRIFREQPFLLLLWLRVWSKEAPYTCCFPFFYNYWTHDKEYGDVWKVKFLSRFKHAHEYDYSGNSPFWD